MDRRTWIIAGAVAVAVLIGIGLLSSRGKKSSVQATESQRLPAKSVHEQAVAFKEDGKLLAARDSYKKMVMDYSDYENIEQVQKELEALNLKIITSNVEMPQKTVIHEVQSGDTLGKLAKQYETTVELIKKRNNLKSDVIRLGQRLGIWNAPFNIFIDKSQNILMLKSKDEIVKVYRVSTGANNITPVGNFTITTKLVDPVWFKSGAIIPPDSPQNELGSRWLGFDLPGYGIHGTVKPETIGQQVTAGCVRMRNPEVEELYEIVPLGTQVQVVD